MKKLFLLMAAVVAFAACGGGNAPQEQQSAAESDDALTSLTDINAVENTSNRVNVITQALPNIMAIPSDQCLNNLGFMTTEVANGKTNYIRDYAGFILKDETNKLVVRAIQNYFIEIGFPLTDLEQALKSLNNQAIMDEVDGLAKDAKTMLVTTCSPDIIIEFDYKSDRKAINRTNRVEVFSYNLAAFDAFSTKSVATAYKSDVEGNIAQYIDAHFAEDLSAFTKQVKGYFTDIVTNGREITFRVALDGSALINLTDEYNDFAETYSDWIRTWVKTNAKMGTATMQRNTDKEMYYTNVRITNLGSDGTQYNAFDFANDFRKEFSRTFNIKTTNATQGLADAYVIIK